MKRIGNQPHDIVNVGSTRKDALTLLNQGHVREARRLCERLCRGQHSIPQDWILLATAELRLGEIEAAVASARQAIARGGDAPPALVILTALLVHQGKSLEANSCFTKLLNRGLREAEMHRQLAGVLREIGDHANAIDRYQCAIDLDPEHIPAKFELAVTLQESQQFIQAAEWYEKIIQMRPDHTAAYCNLAGCLASVKQFDRAGRALEQAIRLDPSNAAAHFHLGETYQNQNRFQAAVLCYRRALELRPDEAALHGSLARALRNLGDTNGAIASLRRVLELEPANATAYHDMGICLYDDRDLEPARNAFIQAVRLDSNLAQSHFFLGMIYAQSNEETKASEQFSQACRLWPYLECFVDSYRYAGQAAPNARYLSTAKQVFELAIAHSESDGLYLEFGVYYGASTNIIARLTSATIHGFDTFQGLPNDWVVSDGQRENVEPAGSYSTNGNLPQVPDNVRFHVGTFEETLPEFCRDYNEPVSFINIDCDLYSSTKTIFRHLAGQIQQGTVIVFDDYFCFPGWRNHEFKAFQEFIAEAGLDCEYLGFNFFTGQVVVCMTTQSTLMAVQKTKS